MSVRENHCDLCGRGNPSPRFGKMLCFRCERVLSKEVQKE